jgi:hypothetical protein
MEWPKAVVLNLIEVIILLPPPPPINNNRLPTKNCHTRNITHHKENATS